MNRTSSQVTALALSVLMTLGIVAGMNRLASVQYAAADSRVTAQGGQAQLAVQHVVIVGRRVDA